MKQLVSVDVFGNIPALNQKKAESKRQTLEAELAA
jgi:hypothetical protein